MDINGPIPMENNIPLDNISFLPILKSFQFLHYRMAFFWAVVKVETQPSTPIKDSLQALLKKATFDTYPSSELVLIHRSQHFKQET